MASDPTPIGTPSVSRRRMKDYLSENSGFVLPLGVILAACIWAFLLLFGRIEEGAKRQEETATKVALLEAASSAARTDFTEAIVEMRAARGELTSLRELVIELRTELRAQRRTTPP